jgi:hypothetical protein
MLLLLLFLLLSAVVVAVVGVKCVDVAAGVGECVVGGGNILLFAITFRYLTGTKGEPIDPALFGIATTVSTPLISPQPGASIQKYDTFGGWVS